MLRRIARRADDRDGSRLEQRAQRRGGGHAVAALRPSDRLSADGVSDSWTVDDAAVRSSIGSRSPSRGTPRASRRCRRAWSPGTVGTRLPPLSPRAAPAAACRGPCPGKRRRRRRPTSAAACAERDIGSDRDRRDRRRRPRARRGALQRARRDRSSRTAGRRAASLGSARVKKRRRATPATDRGRSAGRRRGRPASAHRQRAVDPSRSTARAVVLVGRRKRAASARMSGLRNLRRGRRAGRIRARGA